jgi:hypothetical protein
MRKGGKAREWVGVGGCVKEVMVKLLWVPLSGVMWDPSISTINLSVGVQERCCVP